MKETRNRIKPIRARESSYSYYGFAKSRQEITGRAFDECKEVAPKDTDKVLQIPGHEIANVVKEQNNDE